MKKIRNFFSGGLQKKIGILVLVVVILVSGLSMGVLVYQSDSLRDMFGDASTKQQESIQKISSNSLSAVIKRNLSTTNKLEAEVADETFESLRHEVKILAELTQKLFSTEEYLPQPVALPDASLDGKPSLQLLTEEGIDIEDPHVAEVVARIGSMGEEMLSTFKHSKLNSLFIGTPEGVIIAVDDRSGSKFTEDGQLAHIAVRERPWYVGAVETGDLYFTDVEYDNWTDHIGIVCAKPVYVDGELVAVAAADFFLDTMVATINTNRSMNNGFSCIINQNGHVIFSPETSGPLRVQTSEEAEDLRESEDKELAKFVRDVMDGKGGVRVVNMGDSPYYMAGASLDTVGWAVISVINQQTAQQPTVQMIRQHESINNDTMNRIAESIAKYLRADLLLLLGILIVAIMVALIMAKKMVHPLNAMSERVSELEGDQLRFEMDDTFRTNDEIEVLATSFANLTARTARYIEEIKDITAEKERIGVELNMAKTIQESQLPSYFPPYPDRHEFNIYASMTPAKEVGGDFYDFYWVDDDHLALVMADVSGKGVPAALFMMVSRILIKNRLQSGDSPGKALENVNNQLAGSNELDMFVTVWVAVLEISTGKGVAANAGHEHPVLRRAGWKYELVKYRHSLAVGAMEGVPFGEHGFCLNPGDSIFVYTDGVVEASNEAKELFGTERLLETLNKNPDAAPEEALSNVMEGITEFVKGAEQFDDITMLCLTYYGPDGSRQE